VDDSTFYCWSSNDKKDIDDDGRLEVCYNGYWYECRQDQDCNTGEDCIGYECKKTCSTQPGGACDGLQQAGCYTQDPDGSKDSWQHTASGDSYCQATYGSSYDCYCLECMPRGGSCSNGNECCSGFCHLDRCYDCGVTDLNNYFICEACDSSECPDSSRGSDCYWDPSPGPGNCCLDKYDHVGRVLCLETASCYSVPCPYRPPDDPSGGESEWWSYVNCWQDNRREACCYAGVLYGAPYWDWEGVVVLTS